MISKNLVRLVSKNNSLYQNLVKATFCAEQKVHDFSDKHQIPLDKLSEEEHQDRMIKLQREWQEMANQKESEQLEYLNQELSEIQRKKVEIVAEALVDLNMLETRYLTTCVRQKIIKSSNIDLMKLNTDWPAIKQLESGSWPPNNPNWFNQQEAIAKLWPIGQQGMSELFGNVFGGAIMGAQAAAPAAGQQAAGEAEPEEKVVEEKTNFDLELSKYDTSSKIKIIKEVRSILGLGLKEAKEMVEKTPFVLKKGLRKPDAEELKEKLEKAGCTITLK